MKNLLLSLSIITIMLFVACKAEQKKADTSASVTETIVTVEDSAPSADTKTADKKIAEAEAEKGEADTEVETTTAATEKYAKTTTTPEKKKQIKVEVPKAQVTLQTDKPGKDGAIPIIIDPNPVPPTATVGKAGAATTAINTTTKPATTSTPVKPKTETVKPPPPSREADKPRPELRHDEWDNLLRKYVSSTGKVDYAGIKNDKAKLEAYLALLKQFPVQGNWAASKEMAYWINAYNAFTIKLILDNYPVSSITDLEGGKPWDKKWIKLGGKTYSLNNIENDILRPKFKDARIHFAVNCAAKSCPPLLNRAWMATNLERNFEKQAKAFINNPQYNNIDKNRVNISKIFEWYAADFGGSIIDYLNRYANVKIDPGATVDYMEYDWKLN